MRQVTAAVIIEDGRLLLTRRAPGQKLEGLWELPGGKIELRESAQECLERELLEELEMEAVAGPVLVTTAHDYDHGSFELLALDTQRLSAFTLRVHDSFAWVTPESMSDLELAPADVDLVEALRASGQWR